MNPVRIGIIGCGVIGPHHMAAAQASESIDLVAVADLIPERGQAAAEQFGAPKVYVQGTDLIADPEVEAVVLAFPVSTRTALALHAFAHGKHVLTEKPVAMNAAEVRQMIAAKRDLVAACCCSRYGFPEGARIAREFITSGGLGDLMVVRCRELRPAGPPPESMPPTWRLRKAENGGGILMNWGCYDLDFVLGITGWSLQPETALAQTWTVPPQFESHIAPDSDAETYYLGVVRCQGGAVLTVERGEYMPAATDMAWQVIGTRGSLRMQMTSQSPKVIYHDDTSTESGTVTRILWEGEEDMTPVHQGPITDFAQSIRHGTPPRTPLEKALIVQQITDAIYESGATGSAVSVVVL